MTKDQIRTQYEEALSTIACLQLEKTELANKAKHDKAQIDSLYHEISILNKTVVRQAVRLMEH